MLTITQSQSVHQLFYHLVADMRQRNQSGELGVFDVYNLIVPSSSVKTWIMNELASAEGISAMVNAKFWGSYQWQLMSDVLDAQPLSTKDVDSLPNALKAGYQKNRRLVPRDPSLSIGFMQWCIFGFFQQEHRMFSELSEKKQHVHPLYDFFASDDTEEKATQASRWWQLAKQIAQVFSAYLTHRPEWLADWSAKKPVPLDVSMLVAQKDRLNKENGQATTPDWLISRYENVAVWQQHIWCALFVDDFHYRQALYDWFWQKLHEPAYKARLPKQITFFTLPPVPKSELAFIRQLSGYTDVTFLYYNPSQEYWADITDPYWLGKHSLTQPDLARLRETGHFLLARMGKQARDTFKLLIELSGNVDDLFEQVAWQDDFTESEPTNLLQQIQQDILLLQEDGAVDWQIENTLPFDATERTENKKADNSIRINACHSLIRQLEVLREDIVVWLNADASRTLSDVVVMLPDLANHAATVRAIFPNHKGTDGYHLPAKLTGLVEAETETLWHAFHLRYTLLTDRLTSEALFDWLMLPPVFESLGLDYEQMQRGCELLTQAGFKRGFDATHLAGSLATFDGDSRYTLRYALDRLALGLVMPAAPVFMVEPDVSDASNTVQTQHSLPLAEVSLADANIINGLLLAYADLDRCRAHNGQSESVDNWLDSTLLPDLEQHFHHARGQQSWQEITNAMTKLAAAYQSFASASESQNEKDTRCSLEFVLDALGELLASDMRGSEPTGAITFCRMGTIRPVPYKLVAVLNMNIGDYPQREQPNHFNLMHAGLAQVGDRQREDDETGAFLDALMMAENACWFYYNGFSTTDTHQHLPANPLQELMLFLEGIYQKKSAVLDMGVDKDDGKTDEQSASEKITTIPQFIVHTALPFGTDSFQTAITTATNTTSLSTRHQGFWYDLHKVLYSNTEDTSPDQPSKPNKSFVTWSDELCFPNLEESASDTPQSEFIDGKRLLNELAKPAQHFLRSQYIATVEAADSLDNAEPLMLDNLSEYYIRDSLLDDLNEQGMAEGKQDELVRQLKFDTLLPAGVVQAAYLEKAESFLHAQLDELKKYAPEGKTPTHDQTVTIGLKNTPVHITYPLPNADVSLWADALPTNGKDHHKLKLWLAHLLWQVARETTDKQVAEQDGKTLCIYSKNNTVVFAPVNKDTAIACLNDWLAVWQSNQATPIVLPAKYALLAANKLSKDKEELLTKSEMNQWLNGGSQLDYLPDDCALHPAWQLILAGEKPLDRLWQSIDVFVARLYVPLVKAEVKLR